MNHAAGIQDTPYQQTRSGRISRPPAQPIQPFFPPLFGMGDSAENGDLHEMMANGAFQNLHFAQNQVNGYANAGNIDGGLESAWQNSVGGDVQGITPMSHSAEDVEHEAEEEDDGLPEWPLPPQGRGGRKRMPKEEMLARRRARNKESGTLG